MTFDMATALTEEQQDVVDLPVDAAVVVTAGPGTGKTHMLAHRIAHLQRAEALGNDEILALTFSRAAVATLGDRLRALGGDVARVRARTFDSWALELLRDECGDQPAVDVDGGFDGRIRRATAVLDDDTADVLPDLRHVLIDELQDLGGARRRLVITLLTRFDCGFTLVGDLAQSIYGFQEEASDKRSSLVEDLRADLDGPITELSLTQDFRFSTDDARRAVGHGADLRRRSGSTDDRLRALRDTFEGIEFLGALHDEWAVNVVGSEGSTAVICRTNGEALVVAETLQAAGVEHRLRRTATDRLVPGALAGVVHRAGSGVLTRDRFASLVGADGHPAPDALWGQLLRTAADRGGRTVDLSRLRDALIRGRLPDEMVAERDAGVVVSSVHRAKGLEFDRVVVVDPGHRYWDRLEPAERDEEARLLFVALTRARRELWHADPVRLWDVWKHQGTGRWGRFGRARWMRRGIEVGAGDVVAEACGWHADRGAVERAQDTVVASVRRGDPIELRRADTVVLDGEAPEYEVLHADGAVGSASPRFRSTLRCFLTTDRREGVRAYPARITGLRVDGVETVVEALAPTREADLNDFGVRRVPRLAGLSRFEYAKGDVDA